MGGTFSKAPRTVNTQDGFADVGRGEDWISDFFIREKD